MKVSRECMEKRYQPSNLREIDHYDDGCLMVWAGITLDDCTYLHVFTNGTVTAVSRIFREKSACVTDRDICLFLHKFPEESIGSRTHQKWSPTWSPNPQNRRQVLNLITKKDANLALWSRFL
ncbi:hypothetical protein TNCV_3410181 [Trichonephila clavipes]|nr:hypothetical protein TNCV_3410181 [Trichonephila clavipes]